MARRNESSLIVELFKAPWWISAILAVISYLALKFLVPSMLQNSAGLFSQGVAKAAPSLAMLISLVFVFTGITSAIVSVVTKMKEDKNTGRKRELYEQQKSLPDISALKWLEFEEFIGEAYRRQGYQVEERGGNEPDGGIF